MPKCHLQKNTGKNTSQKQNKQWAKYKITNSIKNKKKIIINKQSNKLHKKSKSKQTKTQTKTSKGHILIVS